MRKIKIFMLSISILASSIIFGQEVISSGELSITLAKLDKGVELVSIKKGELELTDNSATRILFALDVSGTLLTSKNGWDSVAIANDGTDCTVLFTKPISSSISKDLTVTVTINTSGNSSEWDLSVTGLGNNSLLTAHYPYLYLKAEGNDFFFLPKYSGQLVKNPKSNSISKTLAYPRGWSCTMQFSAYYNDNYGIYLGTHDPKAAKKDFIIKKLSDGIKFENSIPIPDKTVAGNDWEYSGVFRFELFEGDWFEASQIYKKWASEEADYYPKDTPERNARQNEIGKLGAWIAYADVQSPEVAASTMAGFADALGVPMGVHWYNWNFKMFDTDYPMYFPERDGMADVVSYVQNSKNCTVMPYINGRLFQTDLSEYPLMGYPYATKNSNGTVYTQNFSGHEFAVMCPTQRPWQDILVDASNQLTNRVGCGAMYLDQVTASTIKECMDPTHNHPLGGGSFWRDGYSEMLEKVHATMTDSKKFIATEGCNDYLADVVDGFLTDGWTTDNMVPAFQMVYGGKVQLFGTRAGSASYNEPSFYCKHAQAFVNGIIPGRFFSYMYKDPNAAATAFPYVKRMANVRYKLKDFISFGEMLKPLPIDRSGIPNITTTWMDYGTPVSVTISALQSSIWENKDNDKVVVLFTNASMSQTINFTLDFDGSSYELNGKLKTQKITAETNGDIITKDNSFTMDISIEPMGIVAYVMKPDSITSVSDFNSEGITYKLEQNYPNPFNPTTEISFSIPTAGNTSLEIYNILGQKVATLVNKELNLGLHKYQFDASNLSSGIYFYKLQSNNFTSIKKMMLIK
jgi:hypothetical protein